MLIYWLRIANHILESDSNCLYDAKFFRYADTQSEHYAQPVHESNAVAYVVAEFQSIAEYQSKYHIERKYDSKRHRDAERDGLADLNWYTYLNIDSEL